MSKAKLKIRPARTQDCRLYWRWRNEPSALRHYFSAKPVPWDFHQKWFQEKTMDPKCKLFILESRNKPVGQIRVDLNGRKMGELHISLDKNARGRGFGSEGILAVANKLFKNGSAKTILAHIKPQNIPSVAAFLKAGFYFKKWVKIKGVKCYQFAKGDL